MFRSPPSVVMTFPDTRLWRTTCPRSFQAGRYALAASRMIAGTDPIEHRFPDVNCSLLLIAGATGRSPAALAPRRRPNAYPGGEILKLRSLYSLPAHAAAIRPTNFLATPGPMFTVDVHR
ncbi:MAG: hypothetical protein ABGZ17_05860 [Planctomycetaceae bacterium]